MKTFALDENNNLILSRGNLLFINNADTVVQRVKNRLLFFQGEWFLDLNEGTPWYQEIFVKPINLNRITSVLKQRILETEGVNRITLFDISEYEPNSRKLSINFEAETIYGDIISSAEIPINI